MLTAQTLKKWFQKVGSLANVMPHYFPFLCILLSLSHPNLLGNQYHNIKSFLTKGEHLENICITPLPFPTQTTRVSRKNYAQSSRRGNLSDSSPKL